VLLYALVRHCLRAIDLVWGESAPFPPGSLAFGSAFRLAATLGENRPDMWLQVLLFGVIVAARPKRFRVTVVVASVVVIPVVSFLMARGGSGALSEWLSWIIRVAVAGVVPGVLWVLYTRYADVRRVERV
jgi:hypothetical protein